jgi:acetylornithine deacetylase/succinyl-diaminopimelate desuccinylase-like protein
MTAIQNLILQKFPPLTKEKWETTVSMTSIETSNKAQNKIPDDCQLIIDVRSISPDLEKVENLISEIKKQGAGVEFLAQEQPQITPRDNTFVSQLQHIIEKNTGKRSEFIQRPHGSDVRFYQAKGSSAVEFGPTGYGMHTDEEWVDIKSLDMYYGILKDFLLSL